MLNVSIFLASLGLKSLRENKWSGPINLRKALYATSFDYQVKRLHLGRFKAWIALLRQSGIQVCFSDDQNKLAIREEDVQSSPGIDCLVRFKYSNNLASEPVSEVNVSEDKTTEIVPRAALLIEKIEALLTELKQEIGNTRQGEPISALSQFLEEPKIKTPTSSIMPTSNIVVKENPPLTTNSRDIGGLELF